MATGLMSLVVFLSVIIPSRTGMFYTDRKRYQRLTSDGQEKEIELAYLKATVQSMCKKTMKEMDLDDLTLLTKDESPMFRYIGYYFLYEYHLGNPEKIEEVSANMQVLEPELPNSLVKMMKEGLVKMEESKIN